MIMRRGTMQRQSLFISAGHSNSDPGASGNGLTEADVVLSFRDDLGDYLEKRGIVFTQDGAKGVNLPLRQAAQLAKGIDVALEFHCNAFSKASANGVETLSSPSMKPFGEKLCKVIEESTGISSRGAKAETSGQHSRLAFVSTGGGMIVELFFLTSKEDVQKFQKNRKACIEAVGDCIVQEVCSYD